MGSMLPYIAYLDPMGYILVPSGVMSGVSTSSREIPHNCRFITGKKKTIKWWIVIVRYFWWRRRVLQPVFEKHLLIVPYRILWLSHSLFPPWTSPWSLWTTLSTPQRCLTHQRTGSWDWHLPIFIDLINKSWWKPAGAQLGQQNVSDGVVDALKTSNKCIKMLQTARCPLGVLMGKKQTMFIFICVYILILYM